LTSLPQGFQQPGQAPHVLRRPGPALAQPPRAGPAGADSEEAGGAEPRHPRPGQIPVGTSMRLTNVKLWLLFSGWREFRRVVHRCQAGGDGRCRAYARGAAAQESYGQPRAWGFSSNGMTLPSDDCTREGSRATESGVVGYTRPDRVISGEPEAGATGVDLGEVLALGVDGGADVVQEGGEDRALVPAGWDVCSQHWHDPAKTGDLPSSRFRHDVPQHCTPPRPASLAHHVLQSIEADQRTGQQHQPKPPR
jgi:hypothetical protein